MGYQQLYTDQAVFFRHHDSDSSYTAMHVDNIILTAIRLSLLHFVLEQLASRFDVSSLGDLSWFLRFRFVRNLTKGTIAMSQTTYIATMVAQFNLTNSKPAPSPLEPGNTLSTNDCTSTPAEFEYMKTVPYKEAIGHLMWASLSTCPDITYAVNFLLQFMQNLVPRHWEVVKRVISYCAGTANYILLLGKVQNDPPGLYSISPISVWSDSNWASKGHCKSICGFIFCVGGAIVSWSTKKQHLIAQSSTKAEYIAAAHTTHEALWLNHFLEELAIFLPSPIPLHLDNCRSIDLAVKGQNTEQSKHIDIQHHILCEAIEHGVLIIHQVST
jgi:hypothetical protein